MRWEMETFSCYVVLDGSAAQQILKFKQFCGVGGIKKGLHLTWCHSSLAHSIVRKALLLKDE